MRLRILFILSVGIAVMLAAMLLATRMILIRGAENMELSTMAANLQRVHNAIQRDLASLQQTATDWGSWDETYEFLRTRAPVYIQKNLDVSTLENFDVEVMGFFDTDGSLFHLAYTVPPGAGMTRILEDYPQLAGPGEPRIPRAGLVVLDGRPWLAVARPVLDSGETLPTRGTIVLARQLSDVRLQSLAARVLVQIELLPATGPGAPRITTRLRGREVLNVERPAFDRLRAYTLLTDVAGEPLGILAAETESGIREQALRSTLASVSSIVATGILFGVGALLFLERRVLRRLHSLSSQVLAIKTGELTAQTLEVPGKDEIAYLAAAINGMLASLRSSTEELRQGERRTLAFLEAVPDIIFLLDADLHIRDLRVPEDATVSSEVRGLSIEGLNGEIPWLDRDVRDRLLEAIRISRETQTPGFLEAQLEIGGRRRWYEIRVSGSPSGESVVVARDVTAQHNAVEAERKELLLRETHHRVRNNLQVISSLLALQANAATDPHTRALLEESQDRVRSMSLIHERLSRAERPGGLGFASYLKDLVEHLERSYGDLGRIRIETSLEDAGLPEDASLPAGLVVTELLTNAFRHAYPDGREGRVRVRLERTPQGGVVIRVEDDGVGLPEWVDPDRPSTLGFRIVRALTDQIGATLTLDRGAGTRFVFTLGAAV